ncbi:MAG: hypothetical protein APF81_20935 [Desulfosporosinus sp. BRH_c37]|nr:MAG: hypothetical protein APF81_20935 [Desulfosporosinus sp. BRH_c37]
MTRPVIDPILVAVIGNRLDTITKEIGQTMLRTSRSPIFSEARDFVTGIFDNQNRLVAQTAYIPVLAGCLPYTVKAIYEHFKGDIHEGDVYVVNDPYSGNNHPPDITIAIPVFWQGKFEFWSISKGHHADIGGGGVAGYAPGCTSIFEECIRIVPSRLYSKGVYQTDMWNMILKNVFLTHIVEGDLNCQVGACRIGERGLKTILEKYGSETLYAAMDEIFDASEKHMRSEIAKIPKGKYYAERFVDHDGVNTDKMIKLAVEVTVNDDSMIFDLSASDKQVPGYVNSPIANTVSSCYLAILTTVDSDFAFNEGALRPLTVIAPSGSVVNCEFPAPTTCATIATANPIIETVWLALSQAVPQKVQASWSRWSAPASMGFNPNTGRTFADIHFLCKSGAGATYGFDGWSHLGSIVTCGGLRTPDPELHELSSPYTLLDFEYLVDSGGPGKWRGGWGTLVRWRVDAPGIRSANFGGGCREATAAYGLMGGKPAPKNILQVIRGSEIIPVDAESLLNLEVGDIYEVYESGGGGFGNPLERPAEKVAKDVHDGLVSFKSAKEDYGVVVDPLTFEVDTVATSKLRA